ncbi:MAG: hypothetical protein ACJAWO_001392 [Halieaceae bacterium]|jgi:hypothetical protein
MFSSYAFGQEVYKTPATIENGDTIPVITLTKYQVIARRTWKSRAEFNRFKRLEKKVVKVYPFAHLAANKLELYAIELQRVKTEKEKKRFYKKIEKEIKLEYEGELRKLTVSEGRILIKLLDRETGNTSFSLVSELRGKFSAFLWQGLARVFGHNLKSKYDPEGEDREIEFIVQRIERGILSLQ